MTDKSTNQKPEKITKQDHTNYRMYVVGDKSHKAFLMALAYVKNTKEISLRNDVKRHTVKWTSKFPEDNDPNGKIWFDITVSRPYLIHEIGRAYQRYRDQINQESIHQKIDALQQASKEYEVKPWEIRIGNYFRDRGDKLIRVDYWEYHDKVAMNVGENLHPLTEYIEYLKPMKLTSDELIKFDFNKASIYYKEGFSLKDIEINFLLNKEAAEIAIKGQSIGTIKYVHELQNIYANLYKEQLVV